MLDQATDLFWEKGYRGVSIKDLVKQTGVLAGSIYSCFGNKDGIYTECLHHYASKVSVFYVRAEQAEGPLQQIEALFEELIRDVISDAQNRGCFVVNGLLEIAQEKPEIQKVLRGYVSWSEGWIESRLRQAQEQGQIEPDVDAAELANLLFGIVFAVRVKTRAGESEEKIRRYVEQMVSALLGPVRCDSAA
ncbi:TetR/AcrR family transcriptional regulator [Pelagicoccus sp. SDUM812003]|nr:TetR/AcrR family transcriptional regulator [Pelagicoccus sp. SDUM812003]